MLRQVRHISEGNFYGLRVTNKARKLSLDKELRTLEACKDVQSHVYRKEEKELIGTLKRLQQTKHDHFDHHEDHEQPGRLASHHDRRPSFHAKQHDEHRPLGRPAERHDGKVHVKIRSEISNQRSSAKVPCQVKVVADASDVSVIISLSPTTSSATAAKQITATSLPPVTQPPKREVGTDIHRTQAFMSCVICNLPRYAQGKDNTNICTCHADPSKHPHRGHEYQQGSNKRHTDDEDVKTFAAKRERRRSLEIDELLAPPHTAKKGHQRHHGRSRASSFEEDNKTNAPEIGALRTRGFDEYAAYVPGVGAHVHDEGMRNRGASLSETRSRKNSIDEGRSRWGSYTEGRSRESSFGENDEPHYMRPLKGHYGSRHNRSRQEEELHDLYNRLHRVFHYGEDGVHKYAHHPGTEHPHATHLPLSKSRRDAADHSGVEDQAPAFSGLQHPDNIINHHHFLPYEANKQQKPRTTNHHAPHSPPQPTGYHVTGIDRHGHRQEFYVTPGSTSHIAAAFDRKHEQDSDIHSMLMKLKQLLNVYHEMDNEAPRYPWPSPPSVKFTSEEFQKLRNCRYLRLTKSNEESLQQLENKKNTPS